MHINSKCQLLTNLRGADEANRREIINQLSYVKKTEIIACPTPPPPGPLQFKECPLKSSSGYFDVLPIEILHIIFQFSDLHSLSYFRRLSRLARFSLDNWPVYSTLLQHVPKALLSFIRTKAAFYFTAEQLLGVLHTSECFICGKFGSYLFLPECKRCCFRCFETDMQFCTLNTYEALSWYGRAIFGRPIEGIRVVYTASGWKTEAGFQQRALVATHKDVMGTCIAMGYGRDCGFDIKEKWLWRVFTGKEKYDARQLGLSHRGPVRQLTISFPYLNQGTGICEYAILCRGCSIPCKKFLQSLRASIIPQRCERLFRRLEMEFSEEGFIKHIENCQYAQDIWENSPKSE